MAQIDIWLPVRDGEATLVPAVRSIVRQTFRDWKLILVDDGSRDSTATLADRLSGEDARIQVLHRAPTGIVGALKAAEAVSDAPWIARMDADDVAHPQRLQVQVKIRADIIGSRVRTLGPAAEGMRVYITWLNESQTHEEITNTLFVESPLAHPSVLMKRRAYEKAGGYVAGDFPEDYDLWLRAWRSGARFAKAPRILLAWRDSPRRLTRTHPMYAPEAFHRTKLKYLPDHPMLKHGPFTVWGAGPIGKRWIRDLRKLGFAVEQAIDIDPKKIGRVIGGDVPVRTPEAAIAARAGPILGAVGSRGARDIIRKRLLDEDLVEGRDFLFLA